MKTRKGNFDKDSKPGGTFPKKNHENDSPNVNKLYSLRNNRFLRYKEANKLTPPENDERTRYNSKYSFVVDWQMPE
jgi:hypothetical protein